MTQPVNEVPLEGLRHICDPMQFTFRSTEELTALEEVIGQDRALRAINFGIDINTPHYHLFALGPSGTGKSTTVRKHLEREAINRPIPDDWLYINNFDDQDKPRAIRLPAGVGSRLEKDMDNLVDELKREVPRVFEGEDFNRQQEQLGEEFQKRHQELLEEADTFAKEHGFAIVQTPQGIMIAPVIHGNVLTPDKIDDLDEETRRQIDKHSEEVQAKMRDVMRRIQLLQREARERGGELDKQTVGFTIDHWLEELREHYKEYPAVITFLDAVRKDILENAQAFRQIRQMEQMQAEQGPLAMMLGRQQISFDQYKVNLIVNNADTKGAPVILARNPNYNNLVGRIEHTGQFGMLVTNYSMIKSGLLHKANGGYLMLDIIDVLTKPLAWEGLKRALKNGVIEIESLAEMYGAFATHTLDPEPIPLDIKVVLSGEPMLYYLLHAYDPDFRELFRVKVDFAMRMDRNEIATDQYARFIGTVCREEKLRHFDPSGVAKVVEHGSRLVSHKDKLDTRFGDIVDLIRQSAYWSGKNGHDLVTGDDVKQAITEKVYRANQIEQLLQEMITDGTVLIDIAGENVGQLNGLAVMSMGDYMFGKPSRITARVFTGSAGVVNIDREAKMGGRIHNKGAMILSGYLGGKYATEVPMALTASITFEQVYEEIEGDSASSTELYALLSALSGFPLRQDLAVTGSVNQHGQVQAIGGVNEKIEGHFDVCRAIGLTGNQGVMIPASNVKHLMLREDVVEAVKNGQFHIYPISNIDEGITQLTGIPAGECQPDGSYPDGTVNGEVHRRLKVQAEKVKGFMQSGQNPEKDENA